MQCKICNSDNNPEVKHKAYKCSDCGHVYINYTGDGIHYHKVLYRADGQEGSRGSGEVVDGKFTDKFHDRRNGICDNRVKFLSEYFGNVNSLLDIGAGGGTFLSKVKDKIDLVEGTEVSDICVENLTNDGYTVYHGAFTKMDIEKSYDLVTCWHVLEHVQDIQSFPSKAHKVTNKHLILEVPINRSLRNPDVNFDGHFHYFTEKSMRILFEDLFEITYIGPGVQKPCLLVKMVKK